MNTQMVFCMRNTSPTQHIVVSFNSDECLVACDVTHYSITLTGEAKENKGYILVRTMESGKPVATMGVDRFSARLVDILWHTSVEPPDIPYRGQ